jgi:hypothetical protein
LAVNFDVNKEIAKLTISSVWMPDDDYLSIYAFIFKNSKSWIITTIGVPICW